MEIKDILTMIGMAVAVIASHFKNRTEIEVVNNDLKNHKENHNKLERRVTEHENRIDQKLDGLNDKMDSLRDLIIQNKIK